MSLALAGLLHLALSKAWPAAANRQRVATASLARTCPRGRAAPHELRQEQPVVLDMFLASQVVLPQVRLGALTERFGNFALAVIHPITHEIVRGVEPVVGAPFIRPDLAASSAQWLQTSSTVSLRWFWQVLRKQRPVSLRIYKSILKKCCPTQILLLH